MSSLKSILILATILQGQYGEGEQILDENTEEGGDVAVCCLSDSGFGKLKHKSEINYGWCP